MKIISESYQYMEKCVECNTVFAFNNCDIHKESVHEGEYVRCPKCNHKVYPYREEIRENGLLVGIKSVWNEYDKECSVGWISVKDRLPEIGQEVLVHRPNIIFYPQLVTGRLVLNLHTEKYCWDIDGCDNYLPLGDITHWMNLPETPKI